MSGFLLDTHVVSEISHPQPNFRGLAWLDAIDNDTFYLSVITIGEIRKGIDRLPEGKRRAFLESWFTNDLRHWFAGRIAPVTDAVASEWGAIEAQQQRRGKTLSTSDGLITATALHHGLILVTRNVRDFDGLGVTLFDPWSDGLIGVRSPAL